MISSNVYQIHHFAQPMDGFILSIPRFPQNVCDDINER
jgi:hypothetical protein